MIKISSAAVVAALLLALPAVTQTAPPVGPQPAAAQQFTPSDFRTVLGLSKTSTLDDAVRLFGDYDHAASHLGLYAWMRNGNVWLHFMPGHTVNYWCFSADPSAYRDSPFARLCAAKPSERRGLLSGFTVMGGEMDSDELGVFVDSVSVQVNWH